MHAKTYIATALLLALAACTKFEDADMTKRNTFVHFFSSETNYHGLVAEIDSDGGFIVSGEIRGENGSSDALIVKTDNRGHRIWEKVISNAVINSIRATQNGYILVGDSIELNSGTGSVNVELSELENTYARLMLMDREGNVTAQHISAGRVKVGSDTLTIDYHGSALAIDRDGNIVVLGSYRIPGQSESTFVSAFNPADISDSLWYQPYQYLDGYHLFNCNALHLTPSGDLVLARRINTLEQTLSREFVGVSMLSPNSTVKVHTEYGDSDPRNHSVADIQRSSVGYGLIGTYAETNGLNGNLYFIRLDAQLNIIAGSERYIDGEEVVKNNQLLQSSSRTSSSSMDEGLAIVATHDGFILAGTVTSTPSVGNGGKDILLVKLDPSGNLLWRRLIGGSGDETVSSIRETPDNGLLVCGTNTVNGLSTIMLVKTDSNGNLDN